MTKAAVLVFAVVALVLGLGIGLAGGYSVGLKKGAEQGDKAGYERAQADIKKAQEDLAQRAAAEAAEAANPFQAVNPLEGVTANPFEQAQKALNPFSE